MNFGIKLQRNSARSFRVGKVPVLLGQAGKVLFLMKSTLHAFIPSLSGVPKGMAGRIEGIRTICPWSVWCWRERENESLHMGEGSPKLRFGGLGWSSS